MRLLHVEDDHALASLLRRRLLPDGITVDHAPNVATARELLAAGEYAAVILDLQMPDGSGVDVLRLVRAAHHAVPVLVLSGAGADETIIRVLEAGADDYVVKPVSLDLLRAHVRALVRRGGSAHGDVLRLGDLVIDLGRRETWIEGRPIGLTTLELNVLAYLAARPNQVQSRATLLTAVWGQQPDAAEGASNVVDVTIGRVRRRIGEGENLPVIAPVRGLGYVLRPPGDRTEQG
jgi:DNA-binding response OmpR family regulator